eukprot:scaffold23754_cov106-Isochrysis_galbana.AAC.2
MGGAGGLLWVKGSGTEGSAGRRHSRRRHSPPPPPPRKQVVLAERFGATIDGGLTAHTTHLLLPPALLDPRAIALCPRTQAILEEARGLGIAERLHRVDLRWLLACVAYWRRLPEEDWSAAAYQFLADT